VSVAPSTAGSAGFPAWRRAAYLPHRRQAAATATPTPPPISFDDDGDEPSAPRPAFRLVLPRDKRDRLARRTAALAQRRRCGVPGCGADGLPVLLVETEQEALLCPVHQLVAPDGAPIAGQPMLATAAW
jgi:hypothetical protein